MIDLAMHAMVIKDYAAESDPSRRRLCGAGPGSDLDSGGLTGSLGGKSNFALPRAMFLDPRGFLADVSDETIERARQIGRPFIESLYAFIGCRSDSND